MDRQERTSIAIKGGRSLTKTMTTRYLGGQASMVIALLVMMFFDAGTGWLLTVGLFIATGTIFGLLRTIALRIVASSSYMEIWANESEESLARIEASIEAATQLVVRNTPRKTHKYDDLYP